MLSSIVLPASLPSVWTARGKTLKQYLIEIQVFYTVDLFIQNFYGDVFRISFYSGYSHINISANGANGNILLEVAANIQFEQHRKYFTGIVFGAQRY